MDGAGQLHSVSPVFWLEAVAGHLTRQPRVGLHTECWTLSNISSYLQELLAHGAGVGHLGHVGGAAGSGAEAHLRGAARAGGAVRDWVLFDAGPVLGGVSLAPGDTAAPAGGERGPVGPGGGVGGAGTDGVLDTVS